MRNILLTILPACISATAGPVFGQFCPTWMNSWLCNRDPTGYWIEDSCEDSNSTQLQILSDFYFQTGNKASSGPLFEMGWLSDCEYCGWEGIACNDAGNVTGLEVGDNSEPLTGSIPTSILMLENLESLELHANEFTGEIPSELGMLSSLTNLKVHYNSLRGSLPTEICALGGFNSAGIFISADCGFNNLFGAEVKCEKRTCCDACYSDRLRDAGT